MAKGAIDWISLQMNASHQGSGVRVCSDKCVFEKQDLKSGLDFRGINQNKKQSLSLPGHCKTSLQFQCGVTSELDNASLPWQQQTTTLTLFV